MRFTFDLISDLHIETWQEFDWTGQATSPYCVVAGDVAQDHSTVRRTLQHLGDCYQAVFYIDGNEEHSENLADIEDSYWSLHRAVKDIRNVVYLQNNVVIINGVAILATNGWWGYNFNPWIDQDQSQTWYQHKALVGHETTHDIRSRSHHDAAYMVNSVRKLQTHQDVKAMVLVTHTVPAPWLIEHDIDLQDNYRFNCMGNQHMQAVMESDTEHKIQAWCFGHYHRPVDREQEGIWYVNNCRGRGDTEYCQVAYHPRRITIEY
jgi:predicted phosphodiesterase